MWGLVGHRLALEGPSRLADELVRDPPLPHVPSRSASVVGKALACLLGDRGFETHKRHFPAINLHFCVTSESFNEGVDYSI
mmetsp:Transcript_65901/g.176587  ORF Transcript_65901/g.176587 Transcript_65901/m.176587 type:complete len:81 (+) Transcript_65901:1587-1829(+)